MGFKGNEKPDDRRVAAVDERQARRSGCQTLGKIGAGSPAFPAPALPGSGSKGLSQHHWELKSSQRAPL